MSDCTDCSGWRLISDFLVDAATDPYACVRLFHVMEAKRKAMSPMPPRPAFAELGQPIIVPSRDAVIEEDILV